MDDPRWKPYYWGLYWEYGSLNDFKDLVPNKIERQYCKDGNFWFDFEDAYYYYKLAGKTRKIIRRFPKGYESMANRKLYEKTPSEKGMKDPFQKQLIEK